MLTEFMQKLIEQREKTKEYLESLGYELGEYDFKYNLNIVYKKVENSKFGEHRKFVGYIKEGDLNSLKIVNKEVY